MANAELTKRLTMEHNYEFDVIAKEPSLIVEQGELFVLEVEDSFIQRITSEEHLPLPEVLGEGFRSNPAAGPIYVEGAKPGDVLVVTIHDIVVADTGFTMIIPGSGPLADSAKYPECRGPLTKEIKHLPGPSGTTSDGKGVFNERIVWDLKPHLGVLATAPRNPIVAGADTDFMTGPHGGNIDCPDICRGNKVMLPVAHEGGLLYVADVQSTQASEYAGTAVDARAEVTLSCEVIPDKRIPHPRIETPDEIIQLSNFRPLDDAIHRAHLWLMEWLIEDYGFTPTDAYFQFSANPDVKIHVYRFIISGRAEHTVGVSIPKKHLGRPGSRG